MFVNFSNHPIAKWSEKQKEEARRYGEVVDVHFPYVSPEASGRKVKEIAAGYVEQIMSLHPQCVLCQGEFCVSYHVITALKENGITVVAACSERRAEEIRHGNEMKKISKFSFVQFREY